MISSLRAINLEELFYKYRYPFLFLLLGLISLGLGLFYYKTGGFSSSTTVEVLESTTSAKGSELDLVVEVSGAVENPGVFSLELGSRVEDALIAAGGISADADRVWHEFRTCVVH